MMRRLALLPALCALLLLVAAPARAQTIWAVGDGGVAGPDDDEVGAFIQSHPPVDRFLYLGDVYENGTASEFANNYDPAFGRFKAITAPVPGNHEWDLRAEGYDAYWGTGVQQPGGGHYYSFDLGGWHFVALNSEEPAGTGSPQLAWLKADLARYRGTCTIALIHRPRFSAGPQFNTVSIAQMFTALQGHATALLAGHAHNYQRLLPINGLTQFIVGTGGATASAPDRGDPRVAAAQGPVLGALRIQLGLGVATYAFDSVDGFRVDSGTLQCVPHGPARAKIRVSSPKNRARYRKAPTFRGTARNARSVRLALIHQDKGKRRRCRAFNGFGFVGSSCRSKRSFAASGKPTRWRYRVRKKLQPGDYKLTVQAQSLDLSTARRTVRFSIRKRD